ncbi:2Fe-2S iron-sulfur cluster-binding protein [Altericista sp. CCNU0014]|uniref:2Fe-2S iron-sulfur cluster-binding protein n=1 Tax=Altericista sp. CCNU0014 TaxID=3082949 RepID=UPI00384F55F5
MAKTVKINSINEETAVETNDNLLSLLIKKDLKVSQECGGRGMCATCHIFITDGMEQLSPMSRREQRTLEVITTCKKNSRLACQARVVGEGVVVELPAGMYVTEVEDIESLIGQRAEQDILHPIYGTVLVETGKLITRSMISQLKDTQGEVSKILSQSE